MKKLTSILTLISVLTTISVLAEPKLLDYIVAVVNEEVIVHSELQEELRAAEKNLREQNIQLPSRAKLEKQVLEHLIMTKLQLQLAQRTGIAVEDSQLNERLQKIAAKSQMDLPALRQQLESEGYRYEKLREDIRNHMILENLRQRDVISRINVTAREIDNFLANQVQQNSTQEYRLFHILVATQEDPSPEEIEAKRQKANEILAKLQQGADFQATAVAVSNSRQALEGGDLGWLTPAKIPTLFSKLVNTMTVGEIQGPIRDASGFHIIKLAEQRGSSPKTVTQIQVRHILIKTDQATSDLEAKNRLQALKFRLEQGEDFAELARAHSQDSYSAKQGGLLDWANPGDLISEMEEVVSNLAVKQISEPFKSRYGWHLVQLLERRQHDNSEQALRTQAARQIHQRKAEEELQSWLRQLRDEAYVEYRLEQSDE